MPKKKVKEEALTQYVYPKIGSLNFGYGHDPGYQFFNTELALKAHIEELIEDETIDPDNEEELEFSIVKLVQDGKFRADKIYEISLKQ